MTLKDVNVHAVIDSIKDYVAWHESHAENPLSKVRAQKGNEILAILQNVPGNQGFHDDMVEDIYTLFNECGREAFGCVRPTEGLSFKDAFYYVYHVSVNEISIETKIKKYVNEILPYYKTKPERAISYVAETINSFNKSGEYGAEYEAKKEACKDIILFLVKLI